MFVYSHILPIHKMLLNSVNSISCIHKTNSYVSNLSVLYVTIGLIYCLLAC